MTDLARIGVLQSRFVKSVKREEIRDKRSRRLPVPYLTTRYAPKLLHTRITNISPSFESLSLILRSPALILRYFFVGIRTPRSPLAFPILRLAIPMIMVVVMIVPVPVPTSIPLPSRRPRRPVVPRIAIRGVTRALITRLAEFFWRMVYAANYIPLAQTLSQPSHHSLQQPKRASSTDKRETRTRQTFTALPPQPLIINHILRPRNPPPLPFLHYLFFPRHAPQMEHRLSGRLR